MIVQALSFLSLLLVLPAIVAAQQSPVYRPTPDTLRYLSVNTYMMYFMSGADTLGEPVEVTTLESMVVRRAPQGLALWVRLESMGGPPFESQTEYVVSRSGRVLLIDGMPVAQKPAVPVDVLPRLPDDPIALTIGTTWQDTVSSQGEMPYGMAYYRAFRNYRVAAINDTLGTTVLLLISQGEIQQRQGGWQDSTANQVWWQEVAGPVIDSVWFDANSGHLLATTTVMRLGGSGGAGPKGAAVTMPSGLISVIRKALTP